MDIQKIQYMATARSQGQGTDPQLVTTATMAINCMVDIVYENVYPMDTGVARHHFAER